MNLFKKAIELQIVENMEALAQLKELSYPVWVDPFPISMNSPTPLSHKGKKRHGVYKISHIDDLETALVIGEGVIINRKCRHTFIFENKGKSVLHTGGSSSGCQTAAKMYNHDPEIDNWYMSWCELPKTISVKYEVVLIRELKPEFNLQCMAGI